MHSHRPGPQRHDHAASDWRGVIEGRLSEVAAGFGSNAPGLGRAMADAVLAPGKRFRGALLLIAGGAYASRQPGPPDHAAPDRASPALIDAACAIELAHTASLIVDDLPSMDDAGTRRGRPTTHTVHGEARAILAGVALVTESMRVLTAARGATPEARLRLVEVLARALGPAGLCAGQDMDLHDAKDPASILREQDLKTGALFAAGFEMLGIVLDLPGSETVGLVALGRHLGRVFQSYDDLLDAMSEAEVLGKDTGRDARTTAPARGLMAVATLPEAVAQYDRLRGELTARLDGFGFDPAPLRDYIALVLPAAAPRAA